MPDITITVPISSVFREVARRSSVTVQTDPFYSQKTTEEKQYSQLQGEGDRITSDFVKEAANEVLKAYVSRQGDVEGLGFEYDLASSGDIIYRFLENTDALSINQTAAISTRLRENTENAIIYYTLLSLYRTDGNTNKEAATSLKTVDLIDLLTGDLYRLHD